MTKLEYYQYQAAVAEFLGIQGIQDVVGSGKPVYTFRACRCCGEATGQMMEAEGVGHYRADGKRRQKPSVVKLGLICFACIYYTTYGCLPDGEVEE